MFNLEIKQPTNFIKIAITSSLVAFFISSCGSIPAFSESRKSSAPRILSSHQTHALLTKWSANNYQSLPEHTITYSSHHPLVKANGFTEIRSGYTIRPLASRTKGIGLAAAIKTKPFNGVGNIFSPITSKSYLTNVHSVNLVATQTVKDSKISTHIDIYDSRSARHQGKPLAHQQLIVTDYIHAIPGNSTLKIIGLLRPQQNKPFQGIYLAEPYDSKRIPILMIHGLASSPETFMKLSESINADPELRNKYQLWYYFYPTGTPWIASSSNFRVTYRNLVRNLDPDQNDENIRKTILIGHSMGGLIARSSLSYPGDTIKQAYIGSVPLSEVFVGPELKKMSKYFHYKPLEEPSKVIYLATPHRGSKIADGFIGWVTIKLISIPTFVLKQTTDVLTLNYLNQNMVPESGKKILTEGESSVDQLKPSNPSLNALNRMPKRSQNLTSHSIIGDIGIPIVEMKTDGVVSYHSSHIPISKSETIVPSSHDLCGNKEAIQAVIKILKE